jgi:hypothetical protein
VVGTDVQSTTTDGRSLRLTLLSVQFGTFLTKRLSARSRTKILLLDVIASIAVRVIVMD